MTFPFWVEHLPNQFEIPVFNCWEAALSRNIHLEQELKTLLFRVGEVVYLYHGPGNKKLDTGKLGLLIRDHFSFLDSEDLKFLEQKEMLGLIKGTINPFSVDSLGIKYDKVLICESIFRFSKVYTNDGTTVGTIIFDPKLLLEYYDKVIVDCWSLSDTQSTYFSSPDELRDPIYLQNFHMGATRMNLICHPYVWKPTQAAQWFSESIHNIDFRAKLVCDMCCGTGVLGVFTGLRGASVICSDLNPYATKYSLINSKLNNIKVTSFNGDGFAPIDEFYYRKFDFILANVPSLPISDQSDIDPSITWNENGQTGRSVLDTVLNDSQKFLSTEGKLIFSCFGHQDWSITERYLNLLWRKWDVILCKRFELPVYYQNYAQRWLESGLILSDEKGNLFDEYRVVMAQDCRE